MRTRFLQDQDITKGLLDILLRRQLPAQFGQFPSSPSESAPSPSWSIRRLILNSSMVSCCSYSKSRLRSTSCLSLSSVVSPLL